MVYKDALASGTVALALLYGALYATGVVAVAAAVFTRRDLRERAPGPARRAGARPTCNVFPGRQGLAIPPPFARREPEPFPRVARPPGRRAPCSAQDPMRAHRGFTLIELLVV